MSVKEEMREQLCGTSRRTLLGQCNFELEGRLNFEFKKVWALKKGSFFCGRNK